jgi:hypothetical protein
VAQRMDKSFLSYWGYPVVGIYFLNAAWQFARGVRDDARALALLNGAIRQWA